MQLIVSTDINFQVLLDSVGFIQGATLGILLMILNRRKFRSSFFLGLFLLFFSLELAFFIFINPAISQLFPSLYLLPFYFSWLLFPLFFLYTQQVSILSDNKSTYWLLYPGIASFLLQLIIFCFPYETKQSIYTSRWYGLIVWDFGVYYAWAIGIWNLRLLYKHRIEVNNSYSYINFKELQWARLILIYLLASSVINYILSWGYATIANYRVILAALDLLAIYLIAYFGIVQRNIHSVSSNLSYADNLPNRPIKSNVKDAAKGLPEDLNGLVVDIDSYMIASECFSNPNLTIGDLALVLKVHPRKISSAINSVYRQNFNSYVNKFRVKKAVKLLSSKDFEAFTLEGIGNEAGFHSKSAFYTAFKKETGKTPKNYKMENAA